MEPTLFTLNSFEDYVEYTTLAIYRNRFEDMNSNLMTILNLCAEIGYTEGVERLVSGGANIETMSRFSSRPIHKAVESWHLDTVAFLIAAGANIEVKNAFGQTPLMISTHFVDNRMFALLLEAGAERTIDRNDRNIAFPDEKNSILQEFDHREFVMRPAIVALCGQVLPVEIAELCGDFMFMTAVRRAMDRRLRQE